MNATIGRLWLWVLLLGGVVSIVGCTVADRYLWGDDLTVATSWPESDRRVLEDAFSHWLAAKGKAGQGASVKQRGGISWVVLTPGDDLLRLVRRQGTSPDVVLGGSVSIYGKMARTGLLMPDDRGGSVWRIARRSVIGLALNPEVPHVATARDGHVLAEPSPTEALPAAPTCDDPRRDPLALAWAQAQLGAGTWASGYARLVADAGHSRRVGRGGSALAAVERGEAAVAPILVPETGTRVRPPLLFIPAAGSPELVEGVAILRGSGRASLAGLFLEFLAERGQAEPPSPDLTPDARSDSEDLLAELLGATLVDAQDELWAAWRTLERSGNPERALQWMTQAPPWPPSSIAKILGRDNAMSLLEILTTEITPEADVRAWLLASWLGPQRLIDGALLNELAGAVDGRLVREPRFRAWLEAEWTAWARQRYRRVARLAERAVAPS